MTRLTTQLDRPYMLIDHVVLGLLEEHFLHLDVVDLNEQLSRAEVGELVTWISTCLVAGGVPTELQENLLDGTLWWNGEPLAIFIPPDT